MSACSATEIWYTCRIKSQRVYNTIVRVFVFGKDRASGALLWVVIPIVCLWIGGVITQTPHAYRNGSGAYFQDRRFRSRMGYHRWALGTPCG